MLVIYSQGDTSLNIGTIAATGSSAFYKVPGYDGCSGQSILPQNLCTVFFAFDPATLGAHGGTVNIPSNAPTISVGMTGSGVAAGVFSPNTPSHGFGTVDVFDGTPTNGFFRVTNAGSAPMTFKTPDENGVKLTGADAADFQIISQDCVGQTIAVSAYCDVQVAFDPQSPGAAKQANLHFLHDGVGGASDILLTGEGIAAKFAHSPAALSFGSSSVSAAAVTQNLTITNQGSSPLTISFTEIQGAGAANFTVAATAANTCDDGPVAPTGSCVLPVEFDPSVSGAHSASLVVSHNDPTTAPAGESTIALSGTGIQALATISPGHVDFPSVDVYAGPGAPATLTVANSGNEPVSVTSASITGVNADEFSVTGGTCTVAPPVVLAVGQSCTYLVAFDPSVDLDGRLAELSVQHSGENSPTTASLAGLGVRPELSQFPSELTFEQRKADQGTSAPQWVRFENYGSGPLRMNEQSIAGAAAADYSIYFNDCTGRTLVPSEFCDVAISFDPHSTGTRSAVLRMTHGPLPHTVTDVALNGTAVAAPRLKLSIGFPKSLRLRSTKQITYTIKCPVTCTVTANANLLLPGKGKKVKRSTLGWKQITVKGGKTGKLTFKLAGGQRVALANAARAGKKVRVSASFSGWADGYSEGVTTSGFKLKK